MADYNYGYHYSGGGQNDDDRRKNNKGKKELMSMENKELQEVIDVILQALLEMEERFNKKFDEIDKWFDKIESKK